MEFISIPFSTIKRDFNSLETVLDSLISIPFSTIKSPGRKDKVVRIRRFQFHLVRLKDIRRGLGLSGG